MATPVPRCSIGDGDPIAAYLGGASATSEFLDRWRTPGDSRTKQWEEKFSQQHYVSLATQAWGDALAAAGISADDVDEVVIATAHPRAGGVLAKQLGRPVANDVAATVGNVGAAQPELLLALALERSTPGRTLALISLADGADVLIFRTTDAIASFEPARSIDSQLEHGNDALPYAKMLSWRQIMSPEPPRRPEPVRMSGSAAGRSADWKYGFVGSRDRESGAVHMPPARVSFEGGNVDDMEAVPMADVRGHRRDRDRRPPGLLAQSAGDLRGGRLRRWRPVAGRAVRLHGRRGIARRPRRDDVPAAQRCGRHRQLLLEGSSRYEEVVQ